MPELIRKQVILGQSLQSNVPQEKTNDVTDVVNQVLSRDDGWLSYYRDTVDGLEVSDEAISAVKERETQLSKSAIAECRFMTRLWQGDVAGARTELLDVLDDTAMVDAKLAGWYSLWLGKTYEDAGDEITSIAHYRRARARLSTWLNVKFKNPADNEFAREGLNTLQSELLRVNGNGPQALGDLVAALRLCTRTILDDSKSSNAHEEALRRYGELLGFVAARPDNEQGAGPDVIWLDEERTGGISFELKTNKKEKSEYNKKEVGQALNHLQWMKDNYGDFNFDGLLIVGPGNGCTADSSPPDNLYLVETEKLCAKLDEFTAKLDDLRGRIALERVGALRELGALPEWQANGWFAGLPKKRLKDC